MKDKRYHYLVLLFIFYTLLGIIGTYPLVFHFTDHFFKNQMSGGFIGCDTLQTYFYFWLFKHNIYKGIAPSYNDYEFAINSYQALVGLKGFPLTPLFFLLSFFGDIFAYNALIILSFSFSGLGMYLLVEFLTKNRYSGLIAGTFYAMAPFRVGEIIVYGHIGGFIALFLPYIVYFYEKSLVKKDTRAMLWAGICILMVSFSEWHIMYYILLFTILYLPFKLYQLDKNLSIDAKIKRYLGIFTILSIFIILSVGYIMYNKYSTGLKEFGGWGLDYIKGLSPPLIYFFLNNPINECYLSIVTLTLIATVLIYPRKLPRNPEIWFYTLIFVWSAVLALGPAFPSHSLSLYGLFYEFLPFFNHFRSPLRVLIITAFALSVLLGFAIDKICRFGRNAPKRDIQVFMSILVILLIVDLSMAPVKLTPSDENNRAYKIIKNDPRDMKILEIPILPGEHSVASVYEYYITVHEKRIINGYHPFPPEGYSRIYKELRGLNRGEINNTQYLILKELNVGYVVVHENLFEYLGMEENVTTCISNLLKSQYLDFVGKDNRVWLFEVRYYNETK